MWMRVRKSESEAFYNLCFVTHVTMCFDTKTLFLTFVNGDHERFEGEEAVTIFEELRKKIWGGEQNE